MKRLALGVVALANLASVAPLGAAAPGPQAAAVSEAAAAGAPPAASPAVPPAAGEPRRAQGFASTLSMEALPTGPAAWRGAPSAAAWRNIAGLGGGNRQAARWVLARSLLGEGRGPEAIGVLDVIEQDDADVALVPAWRLARGAALAQTGHWADGLAALDDPALAGNAEACAWRMRAAATAGLAARALAEIGCARPALAARTKPERRPFALAAARAAIEAGRPLEAGPWLRGLDAKDSAAVLLRGKAALALGQAPVGLDALAREGIGEERVDAQLSLLEAAVAQRTTPRPALLAQLQQLRFVWRGGAVERRALQLDYRLSTDAGKRRDALSAGATLIRYFEADAQTPALLAELQATLSAFVARDSAIPVEEAAGLYWDFRDLSPAGAGGDLLVSQLADRLQIIGLYARAGELLHYQLTARVRDIAQGPLSVKVATLAILAGFPDRALRALRDTDGNLYPAQMVWDRHRVEAVALYQLGRTDEALAALQDVPDGDLVRAEIFWKTRDWQDLVATAGPTLPPPGRLSSVAQAILLRHAIALAMLGREADLMRLRARYAASFAGLPTAETFDVLTQAVGSIDPAVVSRAMATLPSVSPAGPVGDLLDAERPAAPAAAAPVSRSS